MLKYCRDFLRRYWQLILILLVSGMFRFYRIGDVPHGLYWDEAAITYNAWGISLWNRDEHAIRLPISFKSFGDYKAPLLIYILAAFYKLIGLSIPALRILVASLGVINVLLIYYVSDRLTNDTNLARIAAICMAIVPWAVHFSRIGSEATLALTLVLAGMSILLKYYHLWAGYLTGLMLIVSSLYAYHSAKIFVPILLVYGAYGLWKKGSMNKYRLVVGLMTALLVTLPILYDSIWGEGFERGKTLIIYQDGSLDISYQLIVRFLSQASVYISPDFWVQNVDVVGLRHGVPGHGVLYYSILVCALVGIWVVLSKQRRYTYLLSLLVMGMLPAILANGNPHAIRSMMALPVVAMLAAIGVRYVQKLLPAWTFLLIGFAFLLESISYLTTYYGSYALDSATAFQFGYKEAIMYAEKEGKQADGFVVTNAYGQPYIYTLLYRKLTPEQFQYGALANYSFHEIDVNTLQPNHMYVATPDEIPPSNEHVIDVILIPDSQQPVFVIAKT